MGQWGKDASIFKTIVSQLPTVSTFAETILYNEIKK